MKTTSIHITALAAISLLVVAHLFLRAPAFPFSPDSANYIEQARYLIQDGSALIRPYGLDGVDKAPSTLFPIGFPLVLAFFGYFGLDARQAAIAVGWISSIILPATLFVSFHRQIGSTYALILAGLCVFSPGVLLHSAMGATDVFSLILVVGSIGLVLNSRTFLPFAISGILAGFAYAVRNAHIALLVSFGVYFLYLWSSSKVQRGETIKQSVAFIAGVAVILLPLFLRNLMVFGVLNPYEMEPSTVSVLVNVRTYIQELIYDITAYRDVGRLIAWSTSGLVAFLLLISLAAWFLLTSSGRFDDKQKKTLFLCSTYSIVGACVVIAARSRYEWGEMINVRHTLQYTPFLFASCFAFMYAHKGKINKSIWHKVLLFPIGIIVILHLAYALRLDRQTQYSYERGASAMSAYNNGNVHLCASEGGALLVSNWAYVFRINCDAPVRQGPEINQNNVINMTPSSTLTAAILDLSSRFIDTPIRIGLFPGRSGITQADLPLQGREIVSLQNAGWRVIKNDTNGLLLVR